MKHALLIAGTHSGVGKTTVALGLMAWLHRQGLTVQPFKVGPDFIDPGHHSAVCGRASRNLDTWMLGADAVRDTYVRASAGADAAVIEGVMGLFDGRGPDDQRGSSADVARLLDVPVVLVIDAGAMAGSAAALVRGFSEFDPAVRVVGVICNRVAGPRHYEYVATAIRKHTKVVPLGWLPKRPEWAVPERHLGLITAADLPDVYQPWNDLADALPETVDLASLLQMSETKEGMKKTPSPSHPVTLSSCHVSVARDAAFCFYYPENLELLEAAGAKITYFSPLTDAELPAGTELVYLGGGYPELHAARLADNVSMQQSLHRHHRHGGRIYAECGGLMYCCKELVSVDGKTFQMLGLLPARTIMQSRLAALGYVTWQGKSASHLGPAGTELRGHEFHYSRLEPLAELTGSAHLLRDGQEPRVDGFQQGSLLAGYAHLHFGSNPEAASRLVAAEK